LFAENEVWVWRKLSCWKWLQGCPIHPMRDLHIAPRITACADYRQNPIDIASFPILV